MDSEVAFKRVIEDFACANCGLHNAGDGYTNHCHRCLRSKHVDNSPGDRAATCGGLMLPVDVTTKRGEYVLVHRCATCGVERRCRTSPMDDLTAIHAVARSKAEAVAHGRRDPRR